MIEMHIMTCCAPTVFTSNSIKRENKLNLMQAGQFTPGWHLQLHSNILDVNIPCCATSTFFLLMNDDEHFVIAGSTVNRAVYFLCINCMIQPIN